MMMTTTTMMRRRRLRRPVTRTQTCPPQANSRSDTTTAACRYQTVAHRSQRSIAVPTAALPHFFFCHSGRGDSMQHAACFPPPHPQSSQCRCHLVSLNTALQSHDALNQDTMYRGSTRTRCAKAQPGHDRSRLNQDTMCQGSSRSRCVKARAAMCLQCVSSVLFFHFSNIEGNINIRPTCASTSPHGFYYFRVFEVFRRQLSRPP